MNVMAKTVVAKMIRRSAAGGAVVFLVALSLAVQVAPALAVYPDPNCAAKSDCPEAKSYFVADPESCKGGKGYCYVKSEDIPLNVYIGDTKAVKDIGQYIATAYQFGIGVAMILAVVMMMIGGVRYLVAGGDAGAVTKAKANISDAIMGLALALGSYLILNTVNPRILRLNVGTGVRYIIPKPVSNCEPFEPSVKCGEVFWLSQKQGATATTPDKDRYEVKTGEKPADAAGDCNGKSCQLAGKNDVDYRCVPGGDSFSCVLCMQTGQACSHIGPSDECCSGICAANAISGGGTCRTGGVGEDCQDVNQCKSGLLCQTRLGNSCSAGLAGSPCDTDDECRNGNICVETDGLYVCEPMVKGGFCDADSDCPGGTKCTQFSALANAFLGPAFSSTYRYCAPGGELPHCLTNSDCNGGACLKTQGFMCTPGDAGTPCLEASDCKSGKCAGDAVTGSLGMCVSGNVSERCDDASDCAAGHCYKGGDFGACQDGAEWSPCSDETNGCNAGLTCDLQNHRCVKPATS